MRSVSGEIRPAKIWKFGPQIWAKGEIGISVNSENAKSAVLGNHMTGNVPSGMLSTEVGRESVTELPYVIALCVSVLLRL